MVYAFIVLSKFQLLLGPLFTRGHLVRLLVFMDVMMSWVAQGILLSHKKTETHSPFKKAHCFSLIYIQLCSFPQCSLWNICYRLFLSYTLSSLLPAAIHYFTAGCAPFSVIGTMCSAPFGMKSHLRSVSTAQH